MNRNGLGLFLPSEEQKANFQSKIKLREKTEKAVEEGIFPRLQFHKPAHECISLRARYPGFLSSDTCARMCQGSSYLVPVLVKTKRPEHVS